MWQYILKTQKHGTRGNCGDFRKEQNQERKNSLPSYNSEGIVTCVT